MAKKKQWKPKPYTKLMHKHYPIGWGTGLDKAEWRDFAEMYGSLSLKANKVFMICPFEGYNKNLN